MKIAGILAFFLFCFTAFTGNAQVVTDSVVAIDAKPSDSVGYVAVPQYKHSIYAELGGNAIVGSVNYERFLPAKKPDAVVALRAGILFIPFGSEGSNFNFDVLVPLEITRSQGRKAVKLEYGAGATIHLSTETFESIDGSFKKESRLEIAPVLRIGARWQVTNSPFFIRAGFTPILIGNDYWKVPLVPYAGLSVGYSFGVRQ